MVGPPMPTTTDPTDIPALASASESATRIDSVTARWSKILPFTHPCDGTAPHPIRRIRPFSMAHTNRRVSVLPTSSPAAIMVLPAIRLHVSCDQTLFPACHQTSFFLRSDFVSLQSDFVSPTIGLR